MQASCISSPAPPHSQVSCCGRSLSAAHIWPGELSSSCFYLLFHPSPEVLHHSQEKDAQRFKQGWEPGVALIRRENVVHRKREEEREGKGGGSQMFLLSPGRIILVLERGGISLPSFSSSGLEQQMVQAGRALR